MTTGRINQVFHMSSMRITAAHINMKVAKLQKHQTHKRHSTNMHAERMHISLKHMLPQFNITTLRTRPAQLSANNMTISSATIAIYVAIAFSKYYIPKTIIVTRNWAIISISLLFGVLAVCLHTKCSLHTF